jgi:signal recognition particle subunit SEC65
MSHTQTPFLTNFSHSWTCLYPIYFDANRSTKNGRQLPLPLCIKGPSVLNLQRAAEPLGFPLAVEMDKRHPREPSVWGRLRVHLPPSDSLKRSQLLREVGKRLGETIGKVPDVTVTSLMGKVATSTAGSSPSKVGSSGSGTNSQHLHSSSLASGQSGEAVSTSGGVTLMVRKKVKNSKKK